MNTDNLNLPLLPTCSKKDELSGGEDRYYISDSEGTQIADGYDYPQIYEICQKVNSHASLVERVKELEAVAVSAQQRYDELYKAYYSQESRRDSLKEGNLLQQLHKLTDHLERMCIASEGKLTTECTLAAQARQVLKETES